MDAGVIRRSSGIVVFSSLRCDNDDEEEEEDEEGLYGRESNPLLEVAIART